MKLFTTAVAALSTALVMGTSASAYDASQGYSPRELDQGEVTATAYGVKTNRNAPNNSVALTSRRPTSYGALNSVTRLSFMATSIPAANGGFGPDSR